MGLIRMYMENMALYMLAALPIYVFLRILFLKIGKKESNAWREIGIAVFSLYMIGLASQTILPKWYVDYNPQTGSRYLHFIMTNELASVNWSPLKTVKMYFGPNRGASDWGSLSLVNLLGNMLIFTPIGILVPLLWNRMCRWWKVFFIGLLVTCTIEFIQLFIGRSSDVDDVILNTVGVMIGYVLFSLVYPKRREAAA